MATINIQIPPNFAQTMRQFIADVQKMQQLVAKFQYTQQRLPSAQILIRSHLSTSNQVSRLTQVIHKMSGILQRTIDKVVSSFGTMAQTFMRTISLTADFLGPIIGAITGIATFGVTTAMTAIYLGYKIGRWLWDGMVKLGDAMLQDYLQATGSYSTIGGLRAYRAAFGFLPEVPLQGMVQARGSVVSPQYAALRLLGVQGQADTADMMMQATMAAAEFMRYQGKGKQLLMAQAMAVTSIFNPKTLLMLASRTKEELEKYKEMYKYYKPMLHIPLEAARGWMNFSKQVKAAGVAIESVIANKLADPSSPFTQAVTELSRSLVHLVTAFADIVLKKENVDKLGKYIDEFAAWLQTDDAKTKIKQLIRDSVEIIKKFMTAIGLLKKAMDLGLIIARRLGMVMPDAEIPAGRRGLGRRIGIERPGGAPPITGEPTLGKYPGRARFFEKTGIARKPWEEKIAPKRGIRPEAGVAAPGRQPADAGRPASGATADRIAMSKAALEDQLRKEGVPEANIKEAANLLAGQGLAESNLTPDLSHDQGTGYGIYGARKDRRTAMLSWLKANGYAPNSLEGQSRYMAHEAMSGKYPRTREILIHADPRYRQNQTNTITKEFENPARVNDRTGHVGAAAGVPANAKGAPSRSPATVPAPAPSPAPAKAPSPAQPTGQRSAAYQRDLDYLTAHGGHSSLLENGEIKDVPAGTPSDKYKEINPEFAARLRAAGEQYKKETGQEPRYGELTRGADVQAIYYDRYRRGTGGIAAPPGRSRHQFGEAGDLPSSGFRDWLYAGNMNKYGLHFPVSGDVPHVQPNWDYKGQPFYTPGPAVSTDAPAPASGAQVQPGVSSTRVPPELSAWVAKKENFTPNAFSDYGQMNIGYGTSAKGRTTITEPEARDEMNQELARHLDRIDQLNPNTPPAIRNSLASLSFNTGGKWLDEPGNLLADAVKRGDWAAAKEQFRRYKHAGGQVLSGLEIRREQEAQAWDDPNFYGSGKGTTAAEDWGGKQDPAAVGAPAATAPGPVQPISGQGGMGVLPGEVNIKRPYHTQGTVTIDGQEFPWASGGVKRGSLPYGTFPINMNDPQMGPWGQAHSIASVGEPGGVIPDPKYPGDPRTGIEIHPWSAKDLDHLYSEGCFAVPTDKWPAFKAALIAKAKTGQLVLSVQPNGRASIVTRKEFESQAQAQPTTTAVPPSPSEVEPVSMGNRGAFKPGVFRFPFTQPADEPSTDTHPIENVKVDNRSDGDVVAPKTNSDNDDGGPKALEREASLAKYGQQTTGKVVPGDPAQMKDEYAITAWDYTRERPIVTYNPELTKSGSPGSRITMSHEFGHAGSKSLIGDPEFRQIQKESSIDHPKFEELRQRIADSENIKKLGPQAMHSKAYREQMLDTDYFIRKFSKQIADDTGKDIGEVGLKASVYNSRLNDLASKKMTETKTPDSKTAEAKKKEKDEAVDHMAPADL